MAENSHHFRVGFAPGEWMGWLGGLHYQRNLLRAVATNPQSRLEPVLFVGEHAEISLLEEFPRLPMVRTGILDRPSLAWAVRAAGRRVLARDFLFERQLRAEGITALSHSSQLWRTPGIAMLGWIADFQHRRLPSFFSRRERRQRDRTFARICDRSTLVIVSSESCRRDLSALYPDHTARARVLRFVAELPDDPDVPSREELATRYGIEGNYFHVANQFWAHKNHSIVLEALSILQEQGARPLVLATGETRDYRNPGHFDALMRTADELGVRELLRPLGIIPYPHVVGLLRHAVALINPSRSEGWNTAVEESKSLGKQVLLSDIDVHREQNPPHAIYFDPDDAHGLAAAMSQTWADRDPVRDELWRDEARQALPKRRLEFAQTYERIVAEAVLGSTGRLDKFG